MPTYLVAGAAGRTGSVVAQTLLDQKSKVRVLVHDAAKGERWKKRGAEVAVGAIDDPHAIAAALRGAEAAYFLIPPPPPSASGILARARKFAEAIVQTVSGSHLKQVVFLSSVGAQLSDGIGMIQALHLAEETLRASKTPITFLRACYFVENWGAALEGARNGELHTFFPADFTFPQVGTHDIGRLAAELLTEHPKAHRNVELAGPVDASPSDVAAVLSKLLESEVKPVSAPVTTVAAAFQGFGFSPEQAGLFQEMYAAIISRRVTFESPATVRRGKETLEQTLGALLKRG
jgi:uncharacterized protein YbjT (DUF2867 family)